MLVKDVMSTRVETIAPASNIRDCARVRSHDDLLVAAQPSIRAAREVHEALLSEGLTPMRHTCATPCKREPAMEEQP
jgi:hypothetical protein